PPGSNGGGSGSAAMAAAALASVTPGGTLDLLRGGSGGGEATQSPWLSVSLAHESVQTRIGDAPLTIEFLDRYKPRKIERSEQVSRQGHLVFQFNPDESQRL